MIFMHDWPNEYYDSTKMDAASGLISEKLDGRVRLKKGLKDIDKGDPPRPVNEKDIYNFIADRYMHRAQDAALVADNAVMEAWKQVKAARYHSQRALAFEAATMRALKEAEPDANKLLKPWPPPTPSLNTYPLPSEGLARAGLLTPIPAGSETPIATLVGKRDPFTFGVHSASVPP